MFIAALFTVAKTWKQPKCPLTDEWMWYICTMEYHSHKKEQNNAICSNMDATKDSHTKSVRVRQIPYDITYMWNLKYDKIGAPIVAPRVKNLISIHEVVDLIPQGVKDLVLPQAVLLWL